MPSIGLSQASQVFQDLTKSNQTDPKYKERKRQRFRDRMIIGGGNNSDSIHSPNQIDPLICEVCRRQSVIWDNRYIKFRCIYADDGCGSSEDSSKRVVNEPAWLRRKRMEWNGTNVINRILDASVKSKDKK